MYKPDAARIATGTHNHIAIKLFLPSKCPYCGMARNNTFHDRWLFGERTQSGGAGYKCRTELGLWWVTRGDECYERHIEILERRVAELEARY